MDGITDGNAFVEHQRKEIIVVRRVASAVVV